MATKKAAKKPTTNKKTNTANKATKTKMTNTAKKATKTKKTNTAKKKQAQPRKNTTKLAKKVSAVKTTKDVKQNVKFQDLLNSIAEYFKNLNKAYYAGFLAILGIILFFSPWLNITILSKLYETIHLDFLSGIFAIPQTLLSLFFSIDSQINSLVSIVDKFTTISDNVDSLNEITQYINTICTVLGVNVAANGETANSIISSIQSAMPSPDQIYQIKQGLYDISSIVKGASLATMIWVLIVIGFNVYAAIVCFAKKKITKGCIAAFTIEGIFVFLIILICLIANSAVQSMVFFMPNVVEPTGWAWLTLIVCIIGIIVSVKYRNSKASKK